MLREKLGNIKYLPSSSVYERDNRELDKKTIDIIINFEKYMKEYFKNKKREREVTDSKQNEKL